MQNGLPAVCGPSSYAAFDVIRVGSVPGQPSGRLDPLASIPPAFPAGILVAEHCGQCRGTEGEGVLAQDPGTAKAKRNADSGASPRERLISSLRPPGRRRSSPAGA